MDSVGSCVVSVVVLELASRKGLFVARALSTVSMRGGKKQDDDDDDDDDDEEDGG